jgi:hypothetical protein
MVHGVRISLIVFSLHSSLHMQMGSQLAMSQGLLAVPLHLHSDITSVADGFGLSTIRDLCGVDQHHAFIH